MSTCVLYVDESGNPRKHHEPLRNGETPIFTLTGCALPLLEWRNIDREYLNLKQRFFKPELQRSSRRPEKYEIKGNTLASPRNKKSQRRHVFINEVCNLVDRYGGRLFCTSVVKDPNNPTQSKSIYTFSLQYMVERFNYFISEHNEFDTGIIIADSTVRFDHDVASSYMSFIFGSTSGKLLTNVYEAPLFANSTLTAGLQIVDNLSSIIFTNHYEYCCRAVPGAISYSHMKQHLQKMKSLEYKSRDRYEGHIKYGFRIIRHDKN